MVAMSQWSYNMASMLNLSQNSAAIRRELLRRIGYTNGLHDIYRFSRVVEILHPAIPCSIPVFRAAIIEEESIGGPKYAQGVIDVAGALGLLEKVGSNISLSDRGYALHAIQRLEESKQLVRAFSLMLVLEADGEATLNLLDLFAAESESTADIGTLLMSRLIKIMDIKQRWAEDCLTSGFARNFVVGEITESRKKLETALDVGKKRIATWRSFDEDRKLDPEQRVRRFVNHTVVPRKGWLLQLGCIEDDSRGRYSLTTEGRRLLSAWKSVDAFEDSVFVFPMGAKALDALGSSGKPQCENPFWWSVAETFHGSSIRRTFEPDEFLEWIELIYPHVKLPLFNEATVGSLYHAASCINATVGKVFTESEFQDQLEVLFHRYSEKIFPLRQRHGQGGYIALKK